MTKQHIEKAKRRAWVERYFHNAGLSDEEVMHFRPLPSENFNDGFDAGVRFALSQQWVSVDVRLLEDEAIVIAHSPNGRIDVLKYHDGKFIDELGQEA